MQKHTRILIAALISSASACALAHSEATHAQAAGPVTLEQKAWGIAGDAKKVSRTINLTMSDAMRFDPRQISVKQGETIQFAIKNGGGRLHEMVIGTAQELDAHAALMLRFPTMEHDEPYMAHVGAAKTGEIIWTFNRPGSFDFACLIAGHYQAGMRGKITVVAP